MTEFTIDYRNLSSFDKAIIKINKRALVAGVDAITYTIINTWDEVVTHDLGFDITVKKALICVKNLFPIVNSWKVLARIEKTENGQNIIYGQELPEKFRTVNFSCDHCGSDRPRLKVIIIQNINTGEYKQVGSTCIDGYVDHRIESYLKSLENFFGNDFVEGYDDDFGSDTFCGTNKYQISTVSFLELVFQVVKNAGYFLSKAKAREQDRYSTSEEVLCYLFSRRRNLENKIEIEDETKAKVADALKWISESTDTSQFVYNLKTACSNSAISWKDTGIVASLVVGYAQHTDTLTITDKKVSNWVGEKGDKLTKTVVYKGFTKYENQYVYNYNSPDYSFIHRFIDEEGNVYTWFTAKDLNLEEGTTITIAGTVKDHKEFKTNKQTVLTRVKEIVYAVN